MFVCQYNILTIPTEDKNRNRTESCSSATASITNFKWTGLGLNVCLRIDRPATYSLLYETAVKIVPGGQGEGGGEFT